MSSAPLAVCFVVDTHAKFALLNALVDHATPRGACFSIICMEDGYGPLHDDMAERGVPVSSLGLHDVTAESIPLGALRLRSLIRSAPPDVVHSMFLYPAVICELATWKMKSAPPTLAARHYNRGIAISAPGLRRHFAELLDSWVVRRSSRVVAVSRSVACTIKDRGRVGARPITVIHNGIDWEKIRVDPARSQSWKERFAHRRLLVAAGRLNPVKGYATLLRALALVRSDLPDVLLLVAGAGAQRDELERMARSMALSDAVKFVGWVPDVHDLIAAADVFVQASLDESFGVAVLEALGLGVPVAATTVGGVRELLGGDYGAIEAGDAAALAARIRHCLRNAAAERERAALAAPGVRERFGAQRMADAYLGVYREMAGTGSVA